MRGDEDCFRGGEGGGEAPRPSPKTRGMLKNDAEDTVVRDMVDNEREPG